MHDIDNWLLFSQMRMMASVAEVAGEDVECVCAQLLRDEAKRTRPQEI